MRDILDGPLKNRTFLYTMGLFFGVISFVRKLAVAFFIWMIGIILSKIGYVAGEAQPDGVLLGSRLLHAEGVAVVLLLSMVGAYLLPMTRKRHAALKEAIEKKKRAGNGIRNP